MPIVTDAPNIPESFLEHRQAFASPWLDRWTTPNPFIRLLHDVLKEIGVDLTDFTFNPNPASLGDTFLNIGIRRLNAAVKVGLDSVTFSAANPDWDAAPQLISVFDRVAEKIRELVDASPASQETTLVLHAISTAVNLGTVTASLVRPDLLGDANFYGISLHRSTGTVIIDKSLRYEHAAFVRIQRRFLGEDSLAHVAAAIYDDEVFALRLLGLVDESGGAA